MAKPQDPQAAADAVARMASAAMGGQAPSPQQPAPQAAPTPQTDTSAPAPETDLGQAQTQASPQTEADKMALDAIMYEIPMGEGQDPRKMTPTQIKAVLDRYSSLNYTHSQLKPVIDVVNAYIQQNPNKTPQSIAQTLLDLARADQPNAQFGRAAEQRQDSQAASAPADREALAKWAEDNAVSLPPGYESMMTGMQQQQTAMQQMMTMMQRVLGQSQGMTQAAAIAQRGMQGNKAQMIQQQIGMNLDRVQQHLQLPDDAANDFMMFAGERGYTLEDFVDPQLALKVMTDFKNVLSGPEMQRIRDIATRRQAFTSTGIGGTPAAAPAAAAAPETPLDRLTQQALEKKMGV